MLINNHHYRSIWPETTRYESFFIIDQRRLPHQLEITEITTHQQAAAAITDMAVRGAPLIGVTAAWGLYLATLAAPGSGFNRYLQQAYSQLAAARPTAVNLVWALERMLHHINNAATAGEKRMAARQCALHIWQHDQDTCEQIGLQGLPLIAEISRRKNGQPVNILTHCNAGWLACTDWGTATAPIYQAQRQGIAVHVWVDETRPRNQGASLTAFELGQQGIAHTLVPDNTGGHLMQHGMVDMVITGADRVSAQGDVANKIGTYLKALAAADNRIPFYAALPCSTIDMTISDGVNGIPIEQRNPDEVRFVTGRYENKQVEVLICPENTPAANYGFDVTPARLVTGIITEKGVVKAGRKELERLFNE